MAESLHILLGTSACLQWLCHSGERTVARGPLVFYSPTASFTDLLKALKVFFFFSCCNPPTPFRFFSPTVIKLLPTLLLPFYCLQGR